MYRKPNVDSKETEESDDEEEELYKEHIKEGQHEERDYDIRRKQ